MKHDVKELWESHRETITPAEKGQLTRFKNYLEGLEKESLAMQLAMHSMGNPECLSLFKKGYVNQFFAETPEEESIFVAHYSDGSGCNIFCSSKDAGIYGCEVGEIPEWDWFIDAGYGTWQYLPDDFEIMF